MVRIRTTNEIILSTIDFYRTSQPNLDTKPGSVARDVIIDGPSAELSRLYEELARIRSAQSLRQSLGTDLDRLAQNFGAIRKRGATAFGTAVFTLNALESDVAINRGDIVTGNNGSTFTVTSSVTMSPVFANTFRATASKLRADLDFAGINDEFAIEVPVESTSIGRLGNVSKFALSSTSTANIANVTNVTPFSGGTEAEDDSAFRTRVLSVFGGANTGTELGYRNTATNDPATLDALVIGPGNDLMTRDGTQVTEAEDGTRTIISEGTGGKVDVIVFGVRLTEILDSFIFQDQSNRGDPTDPSNDFVLGQIEGDAGKTVTRKRLENLENQILPNQPVNDLLTVTGSSSGANFQIKETDSLGRITGNFELLRDTGSFSGSPWGFDKLHFISDRITFSEEQTKSRFNGQDPLTFVDVLKVGSAKQNIQIINDNAAVSTSDRTSIQLSHSPITNVTRVFNLTTGERYVIASQNPDGTGLVNETGRIVIRGNTLPAISDTLQVDYTWVYNFDANFDYDNRLTTRNPRDVVDSVDWGFSNAVRREQQQIEINGDLTTVTVTHPITSVISVNTFINEVNAVGLTSGRLSVIVGTAVTNVVSVVRNSDGAELFDTSGTDGSFSGFTIFLPADTLAQGGDSVSITYNAVDNFTVSGISGSFSENIITLSSSTTILAGTTVECNYISNIRTLLPATLLPSLPALRSSNGFQTTLTSSFGTQPTTHIFSSPGIITQNLREAPSRLQLTIAGNVSLGVLTITGTTFTGVFDSVITVSSSGLQHDLSTVIKSALGLNSTSSIPATVSVVRIISVDKVTTTSGLDVLSVDNVYDVKGYQLRDNSFVKSEAVVDSTLSTTQFELPGTPSNVANAPVLGDRLRVTFYIAIADDSENVSFSKSGVLYTNKTYALVDAVTRSSGFTSGTSQTATLTIANQNQPSAGTRYVVSYDYLAPKVNERITIRYNNNSLITDTTLAMEDVRPISADVLVKAANPVSVNVTMAVVASGFENSSTIVQQNVEDIFTSTINAVALGTTLDESDLINAAYSVEGVDRVRPVLFNLEGQIGRVLSITAKENEFIQANNVNVEIETR